MSAQAGPISFRPNRGGYGRALATIVLVCLLLLVLVKDHWRSIVEVTPEAGPAVTPMVTGAAVAPPAGFIGYCVLNLVDCTSKHQSPAVVILTDERDRQLEDVQWSVNHSIRPRENPQHTWQMPTNGAGDCNTYVLVKRRQLMTLGWPENTLLMADAWTETHEGHLVLVARTTAGDLVLDNRVDKVVDWKRLPYEWIARQSVDNPAIWVAIVQVNPTPLISRNDVEDKAAPEVCRVG